MLGQRRGATGSHWDRLGAAGTDHFVAEEKNLKIVVVVVVAAAAAAASPSPSSSSSSSSS
jgi:hypothetical protein